MSLVATLMQPLIAEYKPVLDKNEVRASKYSAWDLFQQQTKRPDSILTDDVNTFIKNSMGNTVQIPVMDADTVTISNTRSCTVADSENTSRLITLTFVTYSFAFTMTPARYQNNYVKYQADWTRKMRKYLLKLAETLDIAAINKLETNKNTYNPAVISNFYPVVGNALQVAASQRDDFYNQASSILNVMDFYGDTNVVISTQGMPMARRLQAQGGSNGTNQGFQFPGYNWYPDNRVTSNAGIMATAYLVPDGQIAVSNRNDWDAVNGSIVGGGLKKWGIQNLPIVDMDFATYYYEDCADRSTLDATTAHLKRTKLEGYEFSSDVVFMTSYNSSPSTRYSPIVKAELAAGTVTT